jgi:UDP-glucose 4-epimerase
VKVLVTGGSGFIGGWVVRELERRNHVPLVFDMHREPADWPVMLGDIRDATAVTEAVAHAEGVIHLAGVLGTQETIGNPRPAAETNILGGLNVLEACAQYDVPLVNIAVGNWFEFSTYSITKYTMERFAQMFHRYRDLSVNTVRALNAYGPEQSVAAPYGTSRVRKIMPSFVARALHGQPIEVYGDGMQIMDMIFVTDVARVLVTALEETAKGYVFPGILEAGTGRRTTVKDIADCVRYEVAEQGGSVPVDVTCLPMRPGETPGVEVLADADTLNWLGIAADDLVRLEDGVHNTVAYYKAMFAR